ncbi:MAG: 8-amino-7-oxononanoate synthase [Mariprofundales bacterium]|nr:8-amino-7-oxononanoate synthase [Mariprofundales bacterium]
MCFSSNDYLGLRTHPEVVAAAREELERDGLGSGGSRLVCGDHPLWHQLEQELATWLGFESALVVGSGMLLNIGLIQALADRHTTLFTDRLNHASLIDGSRLSGAKISRFHHRNLAQLERLLVAEQSRARIIISDALFSMDGDCADVEELLHLAERYDALLLLDDAHGIGTMGVDGRGVVAAAGCSAHPHLIMTGSFGKAFGGYGAFVLAEKPLIMGLIQQMRSLIYSTALPPMIAAAALAALKQIKQGDEVATLHANRELFARLSSCTVPSPIIPWIIGDQTTALAASRELIDAGFNVVAIRPPTVPINTARLRITLSARHTSEQIRGLINALPPRIPLCSPPPCR